MSWLKKLTSGLSKTSAKVTASLSSLLGRSSIDAASIEEVEDALIAADLGTRVAARLAEGVRRHKFDGEVTAPALAGALADGITEILDPVAMPLDIDPAKRPHVVLLVGVNGSGKTTTAGKLAQQWRQQGKSVMLAAGDTFRAAAVEQLQAWGDRHNVPVIAQHTGADSASVLFDALEAATARGVDVLIADTAGRLQNKAHLMDELSKVVRVMRKQNEAVPHETLLVLDAGTGQNAVSQAVEFDQTVGVTGVAVTKLDGTARGGVLFAIAHKLKRPIRFIGVGEQADDLRDFSARDFVDALLDDH